MAEVNVTTESAKVLNYLRQSASTYYKEQVPKAIQGDPDNLKIIGQVIVGDAIVRNEFLSALVNRIGFVAITSRIWENPWAVFNKGLVEYGTTVEEIYVDLAKPFSYDVEISEKNIFKRVIPDVRSAFHCMNWQKFFKQTIQEKDLKRAFLGWDGVSDLIAKIIESMTTSLNYAVYQTMKYLIARTLLQGQGNAKQIPAVSSANMQEIVAIIRENSNNWTILNDKNNIAGVHNHTPKDEQYLIVTNGFDAKMDVEILATAFNMDKTEFFGHRLLIDGFGEIDNDYLADLFSDADGTIDPTYVPITDAEKTALNTIPALMVDERFFQIYQNMHEMAETFNGEGLYWNYWLHEWMTFSVSPFSQRMLFVPDTPSVTSVSLSPISATLTVAGQQIQINATVETDGFAPQTVKWTSDDETVATVDDKGVVTAVGDGVAHIAATSVYDTSVYNTSEITVSIS